MKVRYTVPSDQSSVGYLGNGSTQLFAVPYVFFDDTDLRVVLVDRATGAEAIQVLFVNYSVSGGSGANGSVTMLTAPPNETTLIIEREIPYTQEIDYSPNDGFPAEVNEEGLDRGTMQVQQVRRRARQSPKLPATYNPDNGDISLPLPISGQFLRGRADEAGWENANIPAVPTPGPDGMAVVSTISAARAFTVPPPYVFIGTQRGGLFEWLPASETPDDGALYLQLNIGGVGRFHRVIQGQAYSPMWFGATGDGVTNDSASLITASTAANSAGVFLDGHGLTYKINDPVIGGAKLARGFTLDMRDMRTPTTPCTGGSSRIYGWVTSGTDPFTGGYPTTLLTSSASRYDETLAVLSSAAFEANDLALVYEDAAWDTLNTKKAEFVSVKQALTGSVNLQATLEGNYSTSATLRKIVRSEVVHHDMKFIGLPPKFLAQDALTSLNGSGVVTVNEPGHGRANGEMVELVDVVPFANLALGDLNNRFVVANATLDTYTVSTTGTANATTTGGGSSITAYIPHAGVAHCWHTKVHMENVEGVQTHQAAISLYGCNYVTGAALRGTKLKGHAGYGIVVTGVQNINISSVLGDDCRHVVTHNSGLQGIPNRFSNWGNVVGINMRDATFDCHNGIANGSVELVAHHGTFVNEDVGDAVIIQGSNFNIGRVIVSGLGRNAVFIQPYGHGDGIKGNIYVGSIDFRSHGTGTGSGGSGYAFSLDLAHNGSAPGLATVSLPSISSSATRGVRIEANIADIDDVNIGFCSLMCLGTFSTAYGFYLLNGSGVGLNTGRIKRVAVQNLYVNTPVAVTHAVRLSGASTNVFDQVSIFNLNVVGGGYALYGRYVTALKIGLPLLSGQATGDYDLTSTTKTEATYA